MRVEVLEEKRQAMRCAIDLTTNAKTSLLKWFETEQSFFTIEKQFHVYIEKRPENRQGNTSYYLFFHNKTNDQLRDVLNGRVAILECVIDNQALLAIGFQVRGPKETIETNRRYETHLTFVMNQRHSAAPLPIDLYTALRSLPVAEERSAYVEKRISSWEGYLKIQELNANVEDIEATYEQAFIHEEEKKLTFTCPQLSAKVLRQIQGFGVNIAGLNGDIGQVSAVKPGRGTVDVMLSPRYQRLAKRHEINFQRYQTVTFNNFAELSQVRRLRKGFKDLQNGLAANPNLERVLFEERPIVKITNKKQNLQFHSRLNDYQREAVDGAMNANDVYVIQGPPGTGKTTVIAEICYQNAKAGLKTLVASQANLAVDNALGRLLNDPDIRILRYGRTESIEEEGQKFIEENIAEHWKEQTIEQIEHALATLSATKQQIAATCISLQEQLTGLQTECLHTEGLVEEKKIAVKRLKELVIEQEKGQAVERQLIERLSTHRQTIERYEEQRRQRLEQSQTLTIRLQEGDVSSVEMEQLHKDQKSYVLVEEAMAYANERQQLEQLHRDQVQIAEKEQSLQEIIDRTSIFIEHSIDFTKFSQLVEAVKRYNVTLTDDLHGQLEKLDRDMFIVKEKMAQYEKNEWELVDDRLVKAIPMLEEVLKQQGFYSEEMHRRPIRYQFKTADEVQQFLNRIGAFLVQAKTKEMLGTRSFSSEKFDALERIADAYVLLGNIRAKIRFEHQASQSIQQEVALCKRRYEHLKEMIIQTVNRHLSKDQTEQELLATEQKRIREQVEVSEKVLETIQVPTNPPESVEDLEKELLALSDAIEKTEAKQAQYAVAKREFEIHQNALAELEGQNRQLTEEIVQVEEAHVEALAVLQTLAEERQVVEAIAISTPENTLNKLLEKKATLQKDLQEQEAILQRYPAQEQVQQQWLTMLQEATEYDLQEIKKLYIQHANVIGTTCVASARKEFMETYPIFDVVIIDEVSKATPPELLLPMLKGKKIILVGDHHQLPPLIGQETTEEFLETVENQKDRKELAALLHESLFERLFRTLPKQNKTMLGIQYRMHETIMNTITPFYNEDGYVLQCGLENSDEARDHLLESTHIARTDRLLWFDMPHEKAYFEERVKGGTSRFNASELTAIRQLLLELNEATALAIADGRMPEGAKKHIGIISFYGEQVKRIQRLIEHELHLPYLHCRTGSVDKFQGMEMDVILLSFVRNHDHANGDIGFAKDYRRLNVALSRAKELLMIIGSSEMFTKRPKQRVTREMFERLYQQIEEENGLKQLVVEEGI